MDSPWFLMILKDLWEDFLVMDENQAQEFSNKFFKGLDVNTLKIGGKLSPEILIVKPAARLSWQYHNRHTEIWQVKDLLELLEAILMLKMR